MRASSPRSWPQLWWFPVILACGACSDRADSPRERNARFAEPLTLSGGIRATSSGPQLVRSIAITQAALEWQVATDGDAHLTGRGDALAVSGRGTKTVYVPGPFDPARFNQVELAVSLPARAPVIVGFRRAGKEVRRSDRHWAPTSPDPISVSVHFATNQLETEPYDDMFIEIDEAADGFELHAIDLLRTPLSAFLPADGIEELWFIGDEARRAVGLTQTTRLETDVDLPVGATLSFVHGVDRSLYLEGHAPRLRVELTRDGGNLRSFEFESRRETWTFESLDLSDVEPGPTTITFRLANERELDVGCLLSEVWLNKQSTGAPTVFLITSDTHRADHVAYAPESVDVTTPTLDQLARRGAYFESAWSTSNVTIPSHAALLTGQHPRDTRILDNRSGLAREAWTLAEGFRSVGYSTFAVVSARHLSDKISGMGQGFERMSTTSALERTAQESLAILESWLPEAQGRPLFVWLHLFDAHQEYVPPSEYAAPYIAQLEPREPGGELHFKDVERARYRGEVSYLDAQLAALLEHERVRDGWIAVTADHGESLGEHGIDFHHAELYPRSTHVPLILAGPDVPQERRVARRVRQIDIGRTLLDLSGAGSVEFPGRNLLLGLEEPNPPPVFAIANRGTSASVIHGRWLLIMHLVDHDTPGHRPVHYERHQLELYQIEHDPGCRLNLARKAVHQTQRLRTLLLDWMRAAEPLGWGLRTTLDPELQAELAQLGYAGGAEAGDDAFDIDQCDCEHCAFVRDAE